MVRILKLLLYLLIATVLLVAVYAYVGDLSPTQKDISDPVQLDVN